MKKIVIAFLIILAAACSKKSVPSKTTNATVISGSNTLANNNNSAVITPDSSSSANNAGNSSSVNNINAFIIITDGYGKIINQQQVLPENANVNFDEFQLSKGFSAQQLINLKTRYKIIPPRVLYVNPQNQQSSARGTFYVLGKKFWYWKKKDGFFHLDEKYYL